MAKANTNDREPHPTMVAFLEEIERGDLEKAAKRIASVNDMFGRQRQYLYLSQDELVALLTTCEIATHTSLKTAVAIEKTVWNCPDDQQYSMIFNVVGDQPMPYLYVGRIEEEGARKAREAEFAEKIASGEFPPPPLRLDMKATPAEQAARWEREQIEELEARGKRDILGKAVLSGNLDPIADFTNDETDVAYITHDLFFDVKIKHINGIGLDDTVLTFRRAIAELGQPISVRCKLGEGRWAPHICVWELENPENSLRAEMNFKGEGGSLNSIRVYRKTPEETEQLRQQAVELGAL